MSGWTGDGILPPRGGVVGRVKPILIGVALIVALTMAVVAGASEPAARENGVTLDVKDADVRDVLKSMQKQCGIRNLVIDPDVSGRGTFYFRDVPCDTAFRVVFRTTDLRGRLEPNSVVTVSRR
jgi:type II secretory pathway component GspD/PulD (secretin)